MQVLVTGSRGFIGKNILECLGRMDDITVDVFDRNDTFESLEEKVTNSDFIFHLAGTNRPETSEEFYKGNSVLTERIVEIVQRKERPIPILLSSSTQVEQDNDYGKSKLGGEKALIEYSNAIDAPVYIYRLPNVFGKWSRPNYNTVIATWCHNLTSGFPIKVNDESIELSLVYIDDVVDHFVRHLKNNAKSGVSFYEVSPFYKKTLGEIRDLLLMFKKSREILLVPRVGSGFERALYATYLSFLSTSDFSYTLKGYEDERGTFYEFLKTIDSGQFSISTTAPGVTRGNHYHNTKNEKFLVIKGKASIKHRQINSNEVVEYKVSDKKMEVVEMIPGYTHDITNTGDCEMILLLWANEVFDRDEPDTFAKVV